MGVSFHPGLNNFKLSSDVFSGEGWGRVLTLNKKSDVSISYRAKASGTGPGAFELREFIVNISVAKTHS